MKIDGRTMAGIKLGKPLILLLKKDEPGRTCRGGTNCSVEGAVSDVAKDGL
jgi:hypothetical protein